MIFKILVRFWEILFIKGRLEVGKIYFIVWFIYGVFGFFYVCFCEVMFFI